MTVHQLRLLPLPGGTWVSFGSSTAWWPAQFG